MNTPIPSYVRQSPTWLPELKERESRFESFGVSYQPTELMTVQPIAGL